MGLAKRRLYKPERAPARKKGALVGELAPISLPDASPGEVAKAIWAISKQAGVTIGRGSGYDALKDVYTVIGKSAATGKAQDFKIQGLEVAQCIKMARILNGGKMESAAERNRASSKTRAGLPGLPVSQGR